MGKVPEYNRKATDNYLKKFDRVMVNLPKGTKEKILATGKSCNAFVLDAVLKELERLEKES